MPARASWPVLLVLATGVALVHAVVLNSLSGSSAEPSRPSRVARVTLRQAAPLAPSPPMHATQHTQRSPVDRTPRTLEHATPAGHPAANNGPTPRPATCWPAEQLDRRALPLSAPDLSSLDHTQLSGLPMRLRLVIDAQGQVIDVQALQVAQDDQGALPVLRALFQATRFVPGRLKGRDVVSCTDLALGVETLLE